MKTNEEICDAIKELNAACAERKISFVGAVCFEDGDAYTSVSGYTVQLFGIGQMVINHISEIDVAKRSRLGNVVPFDVKNH